MDIGGTKVAAGVVDEFGTIVARARMATPSHSPRAVEDTIVDVVEQLRRHHRVASVGIGAAGWVDTDQSVVRFSPHLAWRSEPLKQSLQSRIDLPLLVDNDANAAAWAEYRFGVGSHAGVMVCITLGTGIGGALVINGQVFRGRFGMAGEWGHMITVPGGHRCPCGNRGCWEQYASGNALVREARELALGGSPQAQRLLDSCGKPADEITGRDVTAAALAGDQTSIELIADVGRWLGEGIANLAAALDPDLFVIGGGLSEAGVRPHTHRTRVPSAGRARAGSLPQRRRIDRRGGPGSALAGGAARSTHRVLAAPTRRTAGRAAAGHPPRVAIQAHGVRVRRPPAVGARTSMGGRTTR